MSKIGGRRPVSLSGVLPLFPFNLISSLHISLICWGETQVPLQACAIICSFWGRAPEVLHSVRTCNVDSISAAIRPHLLYQTCLSVISPPPHTPPPVLPPSLSIYLSLHSPHVAVLPPSTLFQFYHPSTHALIPARSSTHLSNPGSSFPPYLHHTFDHPCFLSSSPLSTPLHSNPIPSLAPGEPCKLLIQQSAAIKICNDIFEGKEACVVFNSFLMAVRLNSPLS